MATGAIARHIQSRTIFLVPRFSLVGALLRNQAFVCKLSTIFPLHELGLDFVDGPASIEVSSRWLRNASTEGLSERFTRYTVARTAVRGQRRLHHGI